MWSLLMNENKYKFVAPGDNATVSCELIKPTPIDKGLKFAMRDGGMTIGHGVITKILE